MLNLGTLRRRITTSIWIKGIEIELLLITFTNFNYALYLITCMPWLNFFALDKECIVSGMKYEKLSKLKSATMHALGERIMQ